MDQIETRELAYFIALAEELHFGRAAERLGIAQPPLSRAIARLERRVGVRLFERSSRRVSLTAAGEAFCIGSRQTLAAMNRAVRQARSAGGRSPLTVAARPGTGSGLLADILRAYDGRAAVAPTEVTFTADPAGAVRDGRADVALICDSDTAADEDLDVAHLTAESPLVLLPAGHLLAARATVTVADLQRDPAYRPQCPVEPLDAVVERVALGRLVVVVGESATSRLGDAVTAVPVSDLPATELVLAWRDNPGRRDLPDFVRTAVAVAGP
jgi:DNA-binding transcriptional LysR family regulator